MPICRHRARVIVANCKDSMTVWGGGGIDKSGDGNRKTNDSVKVPTDYDQNSVFVLVKL